MGKHSVHTNIALDYPTMWTGVIFSLANFKAIFERDDFIEKVVSRKLLGLYNFKKADQPFGEEQASHIVVDAYITHDFEIMFDIETLDTPSGRELEIGLCNHPKNHLAKIVVVMDKKKPTGGVLNVKDVICVHINRVVKQS